MLVQAHTHVSEKHGPHPLSPSGPLARLDLVAGAAETDRFECLVDLVERFLTKV